MSTDESRCVLVTGASSGIGRATAARFARAGDRVFGTSRHPQASLCGSLAGVSMVPLDVRDPDSVGACVEAVIKNGGPIDVLVNNAGVMQLEVAEETTRDQIDDLFETNVFGPVRMINAVLPSLRGRRSGRIINVGSVAASIGEPGEAFYAGSKAALARYTEALRHEVAHLGIHVSVVEPGVYRTAVLDNALTADAVIEDYEPVREAIRTTMSRAVGHADDPDRVAALIVRIAATRHPLGRYGAGSDARWLPAAKALLPQALLDRLLRSGYHLPSQPEKH